MLNVESKKDCILKIHFQQTTHPSSTESISKYVDSFCNIRRHQFWHVSVNKFSRNYYKKIQPKIK
jgi:hypothetical protein